MTSKISHREISRVRNNALDFCPPPNHKLSICAEANGSYKDYLGEIKKKVQIIRERILRSLPNLVNPCCERGVIIFEVSDLA